MASIRISQLASVSAVDANDFLIVNDNDTNTRKISYGDFSTGLIKSVEATQTLTGALTITGGLAAGALNVDDNTLVVDATTDRIGLGVIGPAYTLDVEGDIQIRSGDTLRFADNTNAYAVTLQSPGTLTRSTAYTLPIDYPSQNGMALVSTITGATDWAPILTNPMSAPGQLIVQNQANSTTALNPGTQSQVLTIGSNGMPVWAASQSGFSDPMTTAGDMIFKNVLGVTTRLAAGSNGQVLGIDPTGVPHWTTGATPAGNQGQIQYNNGGALGASASLDFDVSTLTLGTNNLSVSADASFTSIVTDLTPKVDDTHSLGSATLAWKTVYTGAGGGVSFKSPDDSKNGSLTFGNGVGYAFSGDPAGGGTPASVNIYNGNNTNSAGFTVPNGLDNTYKLTLPSAVGASGAILTTTGSGILTWTDTQSGTININTVEAQTLFSSGDLEVGGSASNPNFSVSTIGDVDTVGHYRSNRANENDLLYQGALSDVTTFKVNAEGTTTIGAGSEIVLDHSGTIQAYGEIKSDQPDDNANAKAISTYQNGVLTSRVNVNGAHKIGGNVATGGNGAIGLNPNGVIQLNGDAGQAGQVLTSSGAGAQAVWTTVDGSGPQPLLIGVTGDFTPAAANSLTLTADGNTQEFDLMVAAIMWRRIPSGSSAAVTAPAGWSEVETYLAGEWTTGDTEQFITIYTRLFQSGDTGSYTWTVSDTANRLGGALMTVRDGDVATTSLETTSSNTIGPVASTSGLNLFVGTSILADTGGGDTTYNWTNAAAQSPTSDEDLRLLVASSTSAGNVSLSSNVDQDTPFTFGLVQIVLSSSSIVGTKGEKGSVGEKGDPGDKGINGSDGGKGEKGAPGTNGSNGSNGDKGSKGQKGDTGLSGGQGQQGPKGQKGEGDKGAKGESSGIFTFKGEKPTVGDLPSSSDVPPPQAGDVWRVQNDSKLYAYNGTAWVELGTASVVKGEKGQKGELGANGGKGQKGEVGETGTAGSNGGKGQKGEGGDKGAPGTAGSNGSKGQKGLNGDKGQKGVAGAVTQTTPAGSNNQVQFNDNGAAGADANFTYTGVTLTAPGLVVSGNTTLGGGSSNTINFLGDVHSNFIPSSDNSYTLGSNSARWKELHVGTDIRFATSLNTSQKITRPYTHGNARGLAIGDIEIHTGTGGTGSTWIGHSQGATDASADHQTIIGFEAGYRSPGPDNTLVGYRAGRNLEEISGTRTTNDNVLIGSDLADSSFQVDCYKTIQIGNGIAPSFQNISNSVLIGHNETGSSFKNGKGSTIVNYFGGNALPVTINGSVLIGGAKTDGTYAPINSASTMANIVAIGSTATANAYIQVDWTIVSDARDKVVHGDCPLGLDFVSGLQPKAFRYKESREATVGHGPVRYGFLAQDVMALEGDNPVVVDAEDEDKLRMTSAELIPALVNAVKELKAELAELKAK